MIKELLASSIIALAPMQANNIKKAPSFREYTNIYTTSNYQFSNSGLSFLALDFRVRDPRVFENLGEDVHINFQFPIDTIEIDETTIYDLAYAHAYFSYVFFYNGSILSVYKYSFYNNAPFTQESCEDMELDYYVNELGGLQFELEMAMPKTIEIDYHFEDMHTITNEGEQRQILQSYKPYDYVNSSALSDAYNQALEDIESLEQQQEELENQLAQKDATIENLQAFNGLPNTFMKWVEIPINAMVKLFNLEVLPHFKLGYFLVLPLLFSLVSLVLKLIRGA